jgi:TrmH family RNA methyltransferase
VDPERIAIVLVRPSRAANVAAACRAMKNMGLSRLWVVEPKRWPIEREDRCLAYGAWDVLDAARVAASLAEAVSGSTFVAATSGRAAAGGWSPRRLAAEAAQRAGTGTASVVFGPEASGLLREELDLCHELVHIPTDPAQPSLNLAQAVLLIGYELRLARLERPSSEPPRRADAAAAGELERSLGELRAALLDVGYLDPSNPDRILTELRRLLARAGPTPRELTLLRGLARQVSWAGRIARRPAGTR